VIQNRIVLPILLAAMFVGFGILSGCGARQENGSADGDVENVISQLPPDTPASLSEVDHIVFVGLKESCACTRNRIDESWRVLQNSLATAPETGVQRIQRDIDREEALELHRVKPLMVAPGLYFLNAENQLIELLQGEISEQQLSVLLQPFTD